jgi:hypothetical protein
MANAFGPFRRAWIFVALDFFETPRLRRFLSPLAGFSIKSDMALRINIYIVS